MNHTSIHAFHAMRRTLLEHRRDYDAARRGLPAFRPGPFNWAREHFDSVAAAHPDRVALHLVDLDGEDVCRRSYAQMRDRSNQVAHFLTAQGVRRGDRVLLMLPNTVELWETMLAAIRIGAVVVPTTTLLQGADLTDRLERGDIRHVVATSEKVDELEAQLTDQTRIAVGGAPGWTAFADADEAASSPPAPIPTDSDDPLLLYFTSGTTSRPKLVLHSHASYPVGHLATMYWLGIQPGQLHLNISSPGWAKHAWSNVFAPWNAGAGVFVQQYARFEPEAMLRALVRHGVHTMCAAPTVWRLLIQHDLPSYDVALQELASAGEPLNPSVIEALEDAWGLVPRDGYGQTETTAQIANSPGQRIVPGAMGRAMPGYEMVLLDGSGRETAEEGELAIRLGDARPVGLMTGYAGDEAMSNEALGGTHYRTGDVATRDGDGYFTYVGRADDVFKSSGYRISPFELESVFVQHDAVAEAAVVPSPHETKHTVPKAFVSLVRGRSPSRELALDILRHSRAHLSAFKRVRRVEFAELPKTVSGKIRRSELREREAERVAATDDEGRGTRVFWVEDFGEAYRE